MTPVCGTSLKNNHNTQHKRNTNTQHRNSTNTIPKILQAKHKQDNKKMLQVINIS
jgi:hypothetical protein